ncbi:PREDICTED: aspartic proteinase nepenthesin-1 [Prunus mume]|uniref:Aspartic proteinase nepenthesin-1 n=1 Tax=Prunus mume TaxID=102107 RepID=A0ABM0PEN5_PRUMU|nr:PREDICTED: aspartic proteinase nepenthesin-1 [Prunus mume]
MASALFLILCFTHFFLSSSQPLYLPLTHTLSQTQFNSTQHLLKSTTTRSARRFHHHHRRHNRQTNQVSLPLAPGSDYTLSFTLNSSPPQPVSLYMDTGSDLVWFPCSPFECILCEGKPNSTNPPPKIPKNAAVSCDSRSCSAAHSSLSSANLCAISHCPLDSIEISECSSFSCPPFYYAYADGSFIAKLYKHSLSIPMSTPALVLRNFTFGCSHSSLGEPIGVAGFGRGLLSLPAQLSTFSPHLATQFSYCLVSHSFDQDRVRRPSPLILGPYDQKQKRFGDGAGGSVEYAYTSMLDNPKHPYFYSIGLAGVSVGKKVFPAPEILQGVDENGNGGIVVDSGTTFTMFPQGFYNSLVAEFDRRVGRVHERATRVEDETGLAPCYYYEKVVEVPAVTLHFAGNKSSVLLPRRNYFYEFVDGGDGAGRKRKKVGCWMLMNGGDEAEMSGGPGGILGNYQQQGFEVVYDLEKRRVGFARRQCALLWDSLNQR